MEARKLQKKSCLFLLNVPDDSLDGGVGQRQAGHQPLRGGGREPIQPADIAYANLKKSA